MTKKHFTTVDEYIKTFPEDKQKILNKMRQTIQAAAPLATEVISYSIPAFKLGSMYLIYFACWQHHVSIYPVPAASSIQKEIAPYITGRGTLQFSLDEPIPFDVIKKVVLARASEK